MQGLCQLLYNINRQMRYVTSKNMRINLETWREPVSVANGVLAFDRKEKSTDETVDIVNAWLVLGIIDMSILYSEKTASIMGLGKAVAD